MNDIRGYVVMAVGAVLAMLSPIMDFIYAMLLLLGLNFLFGLVGQGLMVRNGTGRRLACAL